MRRMLAIVIIANYDVPAGGMVYVRLQLKSLKPLGGDCASS